MVAQTRVRANSLAVACACLVLAGILAVVWGVHRPPITAAIALPVTSATSAPAVVGSPPQASSPSASMSPTRGAAAPRRPAVVAAVAAPVKVAIPSIGEGSTLLRLGISADHALAVPDRDHANQAGWYTGSPRPGQDGPAVILGHVTTALGPAVFYRLADVKVGAQVHVTTADATVLSFTVYKVASYAKTVFPASTVYGNTATPELRVITCGGVYDSGTKEYLNNTVLYAHLNT